MEARAEEASLSAPQSARGSAAVEPQTPRDPVLRVRLAALLKAAPWRKQIEFRVVPVNKYVIVEVPAASAPGCWGAGDARYMKLVLPAP